jgi:hypothetical protein
MPKSLANRMNLLRGAEKIAVMLLRTSNREAKRARGPLIDFAGRFKALPSLERDYRPPGMQADQSVNLSYVEAFLLQELLRP